MASKWSSMIKDCARRWVTKAASGIWRTSQRNGISKIWSLCWPTLPLDSQLE